MSAFQYFETLQKRFRMNISARDPMKAKTCKMHHYDCVPHVAAHI